VVAGGACGVGVDGWVSGAVVAGGASGAGVCDEATPVKQTSMSAELLSSSKRRLRIHIRTPPIPNFDHRGENIAAYNIGGTSLVRGRSPDRCQTMGGARAWKTTRCDADTSMATAALSRKLPKTCGSGTGGISAGMIVPARWIRLQIGQRSSARSS